MVHRVETIMQTVQALLTPMASTGGRVYRGKTYKLPEEHPNAILIYQGGDVPEDELTTQGVDSDLQISIVGYVRTTEDQAETELNQLRLEVHRILAAVPALGGLAAINYMRPEGAEAPTAEDDGEHVIASMQMLWTCSYTSDYFDPEL